MNTNHSLGSPDVKQLLVSGYRGKVPMDVRAGDMASWVLIISLNINKLAQLNSQYAKYAKQCKFSQARKAATWCWPCARGGDQSKFDQ